jgi:hypothetical protein
MLSTHALAAAQPKPSPILAPEPPRRRRAMTYPMRIVAYQEIGPVTQDKYSEADLRLAEAQGWSQVFSTVGKAYWREPESGTVRNAVPQWTRDSEQAFELMARYDLLPASGTNDEGEGFLYFPNCPGVKVLLSSHPDKASALRYAVVLATIAKLDNQNGI